LEITDAGFVLLERAPGVSVDFIKQSTEGRMEVQGDIPEIVF
jgi:acyl CoA:acetate/3-ketoacid CoA transferase beta subunit